MTIHPLLQDILEKVSEAGASDCHITVDAAIIVRQQGKLKALSPANSSLEQVTAIVESLLDTQEKMRHFAECKSYDCACTHDDSRFRVNIYREKNNPCLAIRKLESVMHSVKDLNLPETLIDIADVKDGLILFTGPTGSGKSTSLAALIDHINSTRSTHILTIEDPIEYLHHNKRSLVHQRELGVDVTSFSNSLREALREDPDVILVGEMRDIDTMRAALTAAETGHLVFSTLHSSDTVGALDRLLAMFPANEQDSVRRQLAMVLKGIVAQRLIPVNNNSARVPAVEILKISPAVSNLIRTAQFPQIYSMLETGSSQGMQSFDASLASLVKSQIATQDEVSSYVIKRQQFNALLHHDSNKSKQALFQSDTEVFNN